MTDSEAEVCVDFLNLHPEVFATFQPDKITVTYKCDESELHTVEAVYEYVTMINMTEVEGGEDE